MSVVHWTYKIIICVRYIPQVSNFNVFVFISSHLHEFHFNLLSLSQVCSEENINEILDRYLRYNAHAASYTWKYERNVLDMQKTLQENGIKDDDPDFYDLSMNDNIFRQAIHLYFNDDLTEA